MKRAFSTVACQEIGYREVVNCAIKNNLYAIEVRLHNGNRFFDLSVKEIPEAMTCFEENQIIITDLGTGIVIWEYEPEKIAAAQAAVDMAVMVKAKGIRIFLGQFKKLFSEKPKQSYEGIVKSLKEICPYAAERNVEIWIETHNDFSTGKVLKKLVEDVKCENMKIIWDIIHPIEFGEEPKKTLEYIGDRIAHVHLKDGIKCNSPDWIDYTYSKLGEGELPIKKIIKMLEEAGYEGYYSLEWENTWRPEIKNTFGCLGEILEHFNMFMDAE